MSQSEALGKLQNVRETKTLKYSIQNHFVTLEKFAPFAAWIKPARYAEAEPCCTYKLWRTSVMGNAKT